MLILCNYSSLFMKINLFGETHLKDWIRSNHTNLIHWIMIGFEDLYPTIHFTLLFIIVLYLSYFSCHLILNYN